MHRDVMGNPNSLVDHKDRNPLNNTRDNLRIATQSENRRNVIPRHRLTKRSQSRFLGVSWDAIRKKWKAYVGLNYKTIWLGRFDSDVEAAVARDFAAVKFHGDFASLNFPKETA